MTGEGHWRLCGCNVEALWWWSACQVAFWSEHKIGCRNQTCPKFDWQRQSLTGQRGLHGATVGGGCFSTTVLAKECRRFFCGVGFDFLECSLKHMLLLPILHHSVISLMLISAVNQHTRCLQCSTLKTLATQSVHTYTPCTLLWLSSKRTPSVMKVVTIGHIMDALFPATVSGTDQRATSLVRSASHQRAVRSEDNQIRGQPA